MVNTFEDLISANREFATDFEKPSQQHCLCYLAGGRGSDSHGNGSERRVPISL